MKYILLITLFLLPTLLFSESKLDKVKDETKKEKKKKPTKDSSYIKSPHSNNSNHYNHSGSSNYDNHAGDFDSLLVQLAWYTILSIYAVPNHFIDSGGLISFPDYPYHFEQGSSGYLILDDPEFNDAFSLHSSLETKLYEDSILGYGIHVNLYSSWRFDILNDYTFISESLDNDENSNLNLGSSNVTIRFAQNEFIQMRSGLGVNYLFDDDITSTGINFLYAIDIYPINPLFLSLRFDGGTIGSAGYTRLRGLIGFTYKYFELNTGFELISIGDKSLTGLILGFKITF